ncbi:MAG: zinc ribbon domain-containing protein [Proteobacteria bacterium]|nr:zinc ribbon domain-containing protein [Desulfobulbaceae bacterium]MBU4154013.1 zinc ribbon domain-containing protein [Pseudomonadota bacterium]MDP2107085.1 zinc ribbon domain-containing protein [Desulfobulbaceae bacterium]
MPIYEFYCDTCNTVFNFFSSRVNTSATPACPKCNKTLSRQISLFSTLGRAKDDDGMPDIDESRMERVMGELAQEAENINEDDPQQMARIMRRFSEKAGMNLGAGMEEVLSRMEAGEDPEAIEKEMGDILENEDPFTLESRKRKRGGGRSAPIRDETLYEL